MIHVIMTDRRIIRDPGDLATLVAPIPKMPVDVVWISLLRPGVLSGDK